MDKYQEALDRIKNKKAIIDGEKMTIGQAYSQTFPILQELINKHNKYKRAFEILKDKGICVRYDRLYFDYEDYIKLNKEERELLEELMKNG